MHTCFSLFFSAASSLVAFLACLWRDFAVNWARSVMRQSQLMQDTHFKLEERFYEWVSVARLT